VGYHLPYLSKKEFGMSHQDKKSKISTGIVPNYVTLEQAANQFFSAKAFRGIEVRQGSKWTGRMLVMVALFWAWSDRTGLKDRFEQAVRLAGKIFHGLAHPGRTYQGFLKQLQKWESELKPICIAELRTVMKRDLAGQWYIAKFVVFACDGSRVELPRTRSNEAAYSPKRKATKKNRKGGKKNRRAAKPCIKKLKRQSERSIAKRTNSPQMWLTMFWHVGTGLPWTWRSGPSDSSERRHLQEMLPELPENSLITADAGFVGYDLWRSIRESGHSFVIRVGANVRLLKRLGCAREYDHIVYLWPDAVAKKHQPPLILRIVWVHDGKHRMCLATNVLSKSRLSDQEIVEIYKARWGVELFFRTFKQTFGRRKLRSHAAENARLELDWSLIGLWSICLLAQRELAGARRDPRRLSAAAAIKAVQRTIRDYCVRPEYPEEVLWVMLRSALLDDYERTSSKAARDYPRRKGRERTGVPKIHVASRAQRIAARELTTKQLEFQLTA
jgi:hypothetical protein